MTVVEQQKYQVRFDWALSGATATGSDADVIVWVDQLTDGLVDVAALPAQAAVIAADLRTVSAAAAWVVQLQHQLGRRISIAVVAAGTARADGSDRCSVEDLLAAGAFIDELAGLGLDATSPEAAAAQAAFAGLKRAVGHLISASVSATENPTTSVSKTDRSLTANDVLVLRPHPGLAGA